jgi:hypothetical protein
VFEGIDWINLAKDRGDANSCVHGNESYVSIRAFLDFLSEC